MYERINNMIQSVLDSDDSISDDNATEANLLEELDEPFSTGSMVIY